MRTPSIDEISRSLIAAGAEPAVPAADTWPVPEWLGDCLPPVESFDERLLPDALRAFVCDIADRMQVPPDLPAAGAVVSFAGAVGRRARITPKRVDHSWSVVPNLWGAIVAPPGQLKSPVIAAVMEPLRRIDTRWRAEHEVAMEDYRIAAEDAELQHAAWKEQRKAAFKGKNGTASAERPMRKLVPPAERRLVVNDATTEALHELMGKNPAGIIVVRDELTGWLSQIDRPGREGERAFALEAWNGDGGHTVDRIGRGSVWVPHCCMSLLGGIQPARLRSYLADAMADRPGNDGLIQRFQVLVYPDTFTGKYVDRAPVSAYADAVGAIFDRIVEMNPEEPALFRFDTHAQLLFEEWYQEIDSRAKDPAAHPAVAAHLAKYRSLMPSLALLFEVVDGGVSGLIDLNNARRAASWCEYLESHARRTYASIVSPQMLAARDLAEKLKSKKLGANGTFSLREVYIKGWAGLDTPDRARQAAETLADAGWIRRAETEPSPTGGRPGFRYFVNPAVLR